MKSKKLVRRIVERTFAGVNKDGNIDFITVKAERSEPVKLTMKKLEAEGIIVAHRINFRKNAESDSKLKAELNLKSCEANLFHTPKNEDTISSSYPLTDAKTTSPPIPLPLISLFIRP